jgi:integrase
MATVLPPRTLKNGDTAYTVQVYVNGKFHTSTWRRPKDMKEKEAQRNFELFKSKFEVDTRNRLAVQKRETIDRNDRITFGQFADMWQRDSLQNNSATSYNRNEKIVSDLKKFLGHLRLKDIKPLDTKQLLDYLNTKSVIRDTARMKKSLESIFEKTNIDKLCRENDFSTATVFYARKGNIIRWEYAERIAKALGVNASEYFTRQVKDKPYSKSTKMIYRRTLFAIFNHAVECEIIERNPAKQIFKTEKISGEYKEKEILSLTETEQLKVALAKETDIRKKLVVAMVLTLGLRKGELIGLQWQDFDFMKNTVVIQRSTSYAGARFGTVTKTPKTDKSKRKLPIPQTLLAVIIEYKKWYDKERQRLADIWQDSEDWVLINAKGDQIDPRTPSWWLHLMLTQNGIPSVGCHSLRHTCITNLLRQRLSPKVVAKFAGHSNPNMTLGIYAHFLEEDNDEVAEVLEKFFVNEPKATVVYLAQAN